MLQALWQLWLVVMLSYYFKEKAAAITENTSQFVEQSTDFKTVVLSILFGIIWGLIIFNIDRFIVASTGKGDGTDAITWRSLEELYLE